MNAQAMTERFEMRLGQSVLERVDEWRSAQDDVPTRSEAVRRLMEIGLATTTEGRKEINVNDGQKLILFMLCELFKSLKLKNVEIDPEFIEDVITGGHYWALDWKYGGIFHDHEDSSAVLSEVVDILDMWRFLERGFSELSKEDKDRVAKEAKPFGDKVKFLGFGGNEEGEYLHIARFLIEKLDRFTEFDSRSLDAHLPTVGTHRRMLAVFGPMRNNLAGRELNADEIIAILKEKLHPSRR